MIVLALGHVDAGLNDGRSHQDVRLAAEKLEHDGFERFGIHLPMRHDDPRFRNDLLQPGAGPFHRLHAIMDKVHLAAASELAENGFPNQLVARADDLRANGQAAGRRRVDDRQISHARHGHLQGPRNRRRGQRQDVHLRAQLLEPLLVLDAEPLFFVDDDQAEIAEPHVLLQQAMGADDDVDGARRHLLQNRLGFFRRLKSRQQRHARRKWRKALGKIIVMLMRQQRGRDQHRHLAVVLHRFECGPHGHLGLAVPHVAADQPVHRLARFHVAGDVLDRFQLIGRFLVFEGGFELVIQRAVVAIGVPLGQLAVGIEIDQFLRHLLDVFLHPRRRPGPARATQPVQAGARGPRRRCTAESD